MIVDSSALIAILQNEPERDRFIDAILMSNKCMLSAVTIVETGIVAEGQSGRKGSEGFDRLLKEIEPAIIPFTAEQAALAREAFRRFGKGRRPARLNFGDCMAYALARERGEPLLFKGDDFPRTDVEAAQY